MSPRLLVVLGVLKIAQLVSAFSILVLAFVAPRYIFVCVILFGGMGALMAFIVIADGLIRGRLMSRSGAVSRAERPFTFWSFIGLYGVALVIGLALTQIWRLNE